MVTLRSIVSIFAGAALLVPLSLAHSLKRNPLSHVSVIGHAHIHTPGRRVHSHSKFDVTFSLRDGEERVRLSLHPNLDLIHDDFAVTYVDADGTIRSTEPVARTEHKVYKGDAYVERPGEEGWSKAGWARITVHRDGKHPIFDGAFRIDGDNHHIQTGTKYDHLKHEHDPTIPDGDGDDDRDEVMVVWRDSDVQQSLGHGELRRGVSQQSLCASDSLAFNSQYDSELRRSNPLQGIDSRSLFGRQAIDGGSSGSGNMDLVSTIGKVDGCPTTRKVALVGIATDCTYWEGFNSSEELRKNVIGMINQASQVYESTFKISLGLKNLTVLERSCPGTPSTSTPWNVDCSASTTISKRLNLFSAWRGQNQDSNAYWTLLTNCRTDAAVGLAWRGQLCRQGSGSSSSGGSSDSSGNTDTVAAANVVVKTPTEWQVFAHETGHTFGAIHDCTSSTCPIDPNAQACCPLSGTLCDAGGKFIMNPSTGPGITDFSACSIGNICSSLKANVQSTCLTDNKNVDIITDSQCGNGIVESGEDCDCGGEQGCNNNPCCDAKTCKFTSSAVCDPSNEDCCSDKCQFASSGTVCRASISECDLQETCPGNAAKCPDDKHKNDGDSCGGGDGLKCASGQCTSRDRQCQVAVGSSPNNGSTKACPDMADKCTVSCTSEKFAFGQRQCLVFNGQDFIDGTPCGAGGHCSYGECKGSSTMKEIGQWITNHKTIVIPVACIVGFFLLLAVGSCIISCCRGRGGRVPKSPPEMAGWPSSRGQQVQQGYGLHGLRPADEYSYPAPNHGYGPIPDDREPWNGNRSGRYA